MCGIVGYIGQKQAAEILVNGLRRLEYRGYDSAGIAIVNGALDVVKKKGKVSALAAMLGEKHPLGSVGIGHTRWATHGAPNDVNAHPHVSQGGTFALVHNGIIENYDTIRARLEEKGYAFRSDTDTEVLANLIEDVQISTGLPLPEAVRQALTQVSGTYGIAIVTREDPDLIIAARKGSPLILGVGDGEYFLGSDAAPIIEHTRKVVYINDGELVVIRRGGYEVRTIQNVRLEKEVHELEWDLERIEKQGYDHFMLKEIMEQPEALSDCLRGRVLLSENSIMLGGLIEVSDQLAAADRIIIAACGTSWHAGLVGEYLIEQFARIPVEVEYASEFRYRKPILRKSDILIVISQSGETADTLAAVREAQEQGILVLGICNGVGSTIARETDAGVFLHVGPEIGVASTKAFSAQVLVLAMIALKLAKLRKTISEAELSDCLHALVQIPQKVAEILKQAPVIEGIAQAYRYASNFLYLGRGYNFPVALEGALKLKEISYIHAEGYPAAEMKHGPIALIDHSMPVVFIAMNDSTYSKVVSNIEEVVARRGSVIAITDNGDSLDRLCEFVLRIPQTHEFLTPLLTVVPLQLLAYYIAVMRDCDVDQPRNLAKSVTVE